MKIKVAFIDADSNYLERIRVKFWKDYSEEIEASYYSSLTGFIENYDKTRASVAVVNSSFQNDISFNKIPCAVLVLSEDNAEGMLGQYVVTAKFQRIEEIYRNILRVYSDKSDTMGDDSFVPKTVGGKKVLAFVSPAGGSGSSTMAIACAEHLAKSGKRVMYLNLEKIAYYYYSGNTSGFEEVLYSVKENKGRLAIKIESLARTSASGVSYLPGIGTALDLNGLGSKEIITLVEGISSIDSIQYIILDLDFVLDKSMFEVLDKVSSVIITTDGSEIANAKTLSALKCLDIVSRDFNIAGKISLIYNRFSIGSFCAELETEYPVLGTVARYKASTTKIIEAIRDLDIFDKLA